MVVEISNCGMSRVSIGDDVVFEGDLDELVFGFFHAYFNLKEDSLDDAFFDCYVKEYFSSRNKEV